jgi:hypothetical protein
VAREGKVSETTTCQSCGWDVPPHAPEGLCARCLLHPSLVREDDGEPEVPHVPRFRVLRRIGTGGSGEVYEAEQEHPRRRVALKLLKGSSEGHGRAHRLRHEADVLGRLQHPCIARVYESGWTGGGDGRGRPFFAMELVGGPGGAPPRTITAYAGAAALDVRRRLALLADVADAVHVAHEGGVIHRDLKPANILVDERGQPRVVDFGVARLAGADARATMLHTQVGQVVGTLAYMSPEQAGGAPAELDARADVYALGAIGYELLSGRPPVALDGMVLHEAVRAVREREPRRLGALDPALRGDVETVIGKALEKEKSRRYASAAELAADLRRCVSDRPVAARPPTALYLLRKTLRRHRAAAWAACAVLLLVGGLTAYGSLRIAGARAAGELARREALAQGHWRLGRLADARREFAAALAAAPTDADRARIRLALSQADERLYHCFHGTPFRVGPVIRADHFDTGGEGVSYHDTDGPNAEAHARADTGVDVINGILSYLRAGEWVQYTIEIPADGIYDFECQGGNTFGPAGVIRVEFDGRDKTGRVPLPGPVPTYRVFGSKGLRLAAGTQVIRVVFEEEAPQGFVGGIEWLRVVPSGQDDGDGAGARRAAQ